MNAKPAWMIYRTTTLVLLLTGLAVAMPTQAEDWLLQESSDAVLYAVYPVRTSNHRISDVRFQRLDLHGRNREPITDFGFSLRVDGETFRFTSSRIERFYLRPWNLFWAGGDLHSFPCSNNFFSARVQGQEESVGRNFRGYQDHYPKGIWFRAAHVQEISVLGESRLRTEYRPIEIWGFANSRANAEYMATFYQQQIRRSIFHRFASDGYRVREYAFAGERFGDRVQGEIIRRYEETQDSGRPFQRRATKGIEHITVRVNQHSRSYSVEVRGFGSPGRRELEIDGRRIFVNLSTSEMWMHSRIWIEFKPHGEPPPLSDLGRFISRCE